MARPGEHSPGPVVFAREPPAATSTARRGEISQRSACGRLACLHRPVDAARARELATQIEAGHAAAYLRQRLGEAGRLRKLSEGDPREGKQPLLRQRALAEPA